LTSRQGRVTEAVPLRGAVADPQQDILKQINDAWNEAKAQLAQLRAAVERTSDLAQAKMESNILTRDRDKALRDLGEAVWALVKAGKMALPQAVSAATKAMQEVERKAEAQNREINSLIMEGGEAVDRLKAARTTTKSHRTAVASKGKKR
jgi:hypothetical protein